MSIHLKRLGPALLTILALGAVAAPGARAADFQFEEENTMLLGEEIEEATEPVKFILPNATATCKKVSFSAIASGKTLTEIVATPTYPDCSWASGKVNVTMNGCTYLFKVDTTNPAIEDNSFYIKCPAGKKMELEFVDYPAKGEKCTLKLGEQQPPKGVIYTVKQGGGLKADVDFTMTSNGATYEKEGGFICLLIGTGKDLQFKGVVTVKNYKVKENEEAGEQLEWWVK